MLHIIAAAPRNLTLCSVMLTALVTIPTTLALVQSASAAPDPSYSVSPSPPVCRVPATYTSTSTPTTGQTITRVEWDFDGDPDFEVDDSTPPFTASHTYLRAGPRTFRMRVTDDSLIDSTTTETQSVIVVTRPPVAAFDFSPVSPLIGEEVLFASNSSDPNGDAIAHSWNFGDGVTSTLANPRHPFADPGTKAVTLRVTDECGASSAVTREVAVQSPVFPTDAPPVAGFAYSPRKPRAGELVEFVSSAVDPEGNLKEQRWDLDGDGEFDDARGDEVLYTFAKAGTQTVRLRVEDAAGGSAIRERDIAVGKGQKARPGFLRPFPIVRIAGEVRQRGALVRLLTVRAPRRARVRLRCKGRGCPARVRRETVGKRRRIRFEGFERMLRAGIKIEIFIRKPDTIGKYTRFRIRRGASPSRRDRCLLPGVRKPRRCPS